MYEDVPQGCLTDNEYTRLLLLTDRFVMLDKAMEETWREIITLMERRYPIEES